MRLVTIRELAATVKRSRRSVQRDIERGLLKVYRIGTRGVRLDLDEVLSQARDRGGRPAGQRQ